MRDAGANAAQGNMNAAANIATGNGTIYTPLRYLANNPNLIIAGLFAPPTGWSMLNYLLGGAPFRMVAMQGIQNMLTVGVMLSKGVIVAAIVVAAGPLFWVGAMELIINPTAGANVLPGLFAGGTGVALTAVLLAEIVWVMVVANYLFGRRQGAQRTRIGEWWQSFRDAYLPGLR